jgi:hypothetical protein
VADFAAGILALADAGANVIIDDATYLDEPVWQDGDPVADAVQAVVKRGVTYISAAGNFGRQTYEAPFRPSGVTREIGGQTIEWKEYVKATGSGIINAVDHRVTTPIRGRPWTPARTSNWTPAAASLNWDCTEISPTPPSATGRARTAIWTCS